jgi:hypothetical protein
MIDDRRPPSTPEELAALSVLIESWLTGQLADNPLVQSVARDGQERRWVIRVTGDEKPVSALWLELGQRSLSFETYVMPAPEENHALLYEHLLRRNEKLRGATFAIGAEDAVFLVGNVPNSFVDEIELDRILGTLYQAVELFFGPAIRIGFASRFI